MGSFSATTGEKLRGGLGAGFAFLWNDRVLRWITSAWVLILAGVGALLVSEFPLAELFGAGSLGYGLLISSWGAGTLIGSVFAARGVKRSDVLVARRWARSASRSCSAASRSHRSCGSSA